MSKKVNAHLGLLFTNIFFAGCLSTVKHLTSNDFIRPFAINLLRIGLTVLFFWIAFLLKPTTWKIEKKDIPRFIICALTGIAINQMLYIKGVSLTLSIHASLLMLITPILISIAAAWLLKERFTIRKASGLILGVSGAIILISGRTVSGSGENILLGDIFILINAIAYTFYMILVKPLMKKYSAIHVMRWAFTIGLFIVFPFCIKDLIAVNWQPWGWLEYFCLSFIIICGTFLAYLFNIYGIKILGASIAGSYIYLQPFFATIIALIFLNEKLVMNQVYAAILIFAGVYLVNKQSGND